MEKEIKLIPQKLDYDCLLRVHSAENIDMKMTTKEVTVPVYG